MLSSRERYRSPSAQARPRFTRAGKLDLPAAMEAYASISRMRIYMNKAVTTSTCVVWMVLN